jgi:hypothetical protein
MSELDVARVVDARPILPRGDKNVWERAEADRARIAQMLDVACTAQGFDALIIQSDPYVHPAWVKFQSWLPKGDRTLTGRSDLTITIEAKPYHTFEVVYSVRWQNQGHSGELDGIYALQEDDIRRLVSRLTSTSDDWDAPRKILSDHRLRKEWWHFWEPTNKLTVVRPDWTRRAAGMSVLLGIAVILYAWFTNDPLFLTTHATTPERPGMSLQESSDRAIPLSGGKAQQRATGFPLLLRTAFEQSVAPEMHPLPVSGSGRGRLDNRDARSERNRPFERWLFEGREGERVTVTATSSAFDTMLVLGTFNQGQVLILAENDDAAGSNSRIEMVLPETGTYALEVSSFDAEQGGEFDIELARVTTSDSSQADVQGALPPAETADNTRSVFDEPRSSNGLIVVAPFLLVIGIVGLYVTGQSPRLVRSAGKPLAEPRFLTSLDSWQTVIFGGGIDAHDIRNRVIALFSARSQERFAFRSETIWRWGLDGKTEREQMVLRYGRALVFCRIYAYGGDLYVGWEADMNLGTWVERRVALGVDRETGQRVELMTVDAGVQKTSEYDLVDLNCLAEWTHAQIVQVLKKYLREKQIDQEIDFSIIRGQRQELSSADEPRKEAAERRFRRKA